MSIARKAKMGTSGFAVLLAVAIMLLSVTATQVVATGKIDNEGSQAGGPGGIIGVVKDTITGDLLEGVTVKAMNDTNVVKGSDTTDATGAYGIASLADGSYKVEFSHADYATFVVTGKTVSAGNTYTLDVSIEALPSTVSGTVTDFKDGMPVMGASVTLHEGMTQQNVVVNETGMFSFTTMARTVTVEASAWSYMNFNSGAIDLGINNDYQMKGPALSRATGTITGQVTGSGGLAGAEVHLVGQFMSMETITNSTGYYTFNVEWGQYTLAVLNDGYFVYSEEVWVSFGAPTTVDVAMSRTPEQNAEVFGFVKNAADKMPIPSAMVCFIDTELDGQLCMMTGMDGYFHFEIYPAYFELEITANSYKGYSGHVSISKDEVKNLGDILLTVLPPMDKMVSGTVKDGANGIQGAQVCIYDAGVQVVCSGTDGAGFYSFMTYAGTFTAKVNAGGYFEKSESLAVTADTTRDFSMTAIPPMVNTMYGYVKDVNGAPIASAKVTLVDQAAGHGGYTIEETTSAGGYYTFYVYDGDFLFIVDHADFNAEIKEVTVDGNENIDVTLDKSGQELQKDMFAFEGWANFTVTMENHIVNDVKLTRYVIDTEYGNGDGTVSATEADAWLQVEQDKGPAVKDTTDLFMVDGTVYGLVDGTFAVTAETVEGDVDNETSIIMTKTADFTAKAAIAAKTNHTIEYNAAFDTSVIDRAAEITVPTGWEARHIDAEYVHVSGTFTVLLDPPMEKTGLNNELVVLNVTGNSPPAADAGKNRTIKVNTNETFDGAASDDDFGISNYTWDFGDGTKGYGVEVVHKFALPGGTDFKNYTVKLTVTDTAGVTNTTSIWVIVDGAPPTVDFWTNKTTANEDRDWIDFNASKTDYETKDNVGVATYTWDFDDGKFGHVAALNHSWVQPGEYNVTLNVTDKAGWWANKTVKVTILDITAPRARITYTQASVLYIEDKTNLTFNGTKSSDNVGVVWYLWNFGDGSNTMNKTTGYDVVYMFTKLGKFNVTLTVGDAAGNKNVSDMISIEVKETPKIPDLRIESIKVTNTNTIKFGADAIQDGDKVKITIKVRNDGDGAIGPGETNEDFSVQFTYGSHKITVKRDQTIGDHDTKEITVYWNKAKQGKYKICAEVDFENKIGEKDENNNKKCTKTYEIGWSWYLIIGIILTVVLVFVFGGVGWYLSNKSKMERREMLRQRKKMK